MGNIYSGFGNHRVHLGYCDDGIIYSGRTPIGRYEGGNIYNQFREHVGSYEGGSIYNRFREHIASYDSGCVYNKYLNIAVGREQIGSYDGDPAAAAALVLLFLGEDVIYRDRREPIKEQPSPTDPPHNDNPPITYGSNDDNYLLYTLFSLLLGLLRLLWLVVKGFFLLFYLPTVLGMTWLGWLATIPIALMVFLGWFPVALVLAIVPFVINIFAFPPYWLMMTWRKITKKLTWGELLRAYVKWFKKGPAVTLQVFKMIFATFKKQCTWKDVWHYSTTWMMD